MKSASKNKRVMLAAVMAGVLCFAIAGCAPKAATPSDDASDSAESDEPSFTITWSPTMDCATCHVDHTSVHEAQAVECVSCHVDETGLSAAHENATVDGPMPTKLKKTTVEVSTCQSAGCHDDAEADFFALTAHVETLVDVQGTKANPHEVMTLTAGHADIVCADCHSEHGPELDEAMVCVSCHHMGTYECNTCHAA